MKYKSMILALIMISFLLLACDNNKKDLSKNSFNNNQWPFLMFDISINGPGRQNVFLTLPDKKVSDMNDDNIFSLFSDGTVIFSVNDWRAGPPYHSVKVSEEQIEAFFEKIKQHKIFDGDQWQFYSGPCSDFIQIYINYSGQKIFYSSWHELFEDNPKLIVMDYGVTILGDKNKEDMIESRSEEYKVFLENWNFLRDNARSLIE